jgi:hypothetical protein
MENRSKNYASFGVRFLTNDIDRALQKDTISQATVSIFETEGGLFTNNQRGNSPTFQKMAK